VCLVQNDLIPAMWEAHHLEPTVAVVWFEKKPTTAVKVIRPTVVGGPTADLVADALAAVGIPASVAASYHEMITALVAKNLYIGVSNIAGIELGAGSTVGELWTEHRGLAEAVASDILDLQEALVPEVLDRDALMADMGDAFAADPEHSAMGRTAPARLHRAAARAAELGLDVPTLRRIGRLG
jgi:hypothetical protein